MSKLDFKRLSSHVLNLNPFFTIAEDKQTGIAVDLSLVESPGWVDLEGEYDLVKTPIFRLYNSGKKPIENISISLSEGRYWKESEMNRIDYRLVEPVEPGTTVQIGQPTEYQKIGTAGYSISLLKIVGNTNHPIIRGADIKVNSVTGVIGGKKIDVPLINRYLFDGKPQRITDRTISNLAGFVRYFAPGRS